MTVVYLDTLFLLNTIVDYLLLLCSARLAGERLNRIGMAIGAVLGGSYAVVTVLPGMGFLLHPLCKVGTAILMVLVGLGRSRRFLRQCVIFFALACAFGGGVLAIGLMGGQGLSLGGGRIYSGMDVKTVLLCAAVCYVLITVALNRVGKHTAGAGELMPVKLRLFDREVSFTALIDTGNTLSDPVTGQQVMVADADSVAALLPRSLLPGKEELKLPDRALTRLNTGRWKGRFRLLPYRAVGVECGLLLAVRVDSLLIKDRDKGAALVALSPTPVSDGGAYRALLGATGK